MAQLTLVKPNHLTAVSLGAVSAGNTGDTFLNNGSVLFYIKNTNASTRTISIKVNGTSLEGLNIKDVVFTVAQNQEKVIGPFQPRYFNDLNGLITIQYDNNVGLTISAIQGRN